MTKLAVDILLSLAVAFLVTLLFDRARPPKRRHDESLMFPVVATTTLIASIFVPGTLPPIVYWIPFFVVGVATGVVVALTRGRTRSRPVAADKAFADEPVDQWGRPTDADEWHQPPAEIDRSPTLAPSAPEDVTDPVPEEPPDLRGDTDVEDDPVEEDMAENRAAIATASAYAWVMLLGLFIAVMAALFGPMVAGG